MDSRAFLCWAQHSTGYIALPEEIEGTLCDKRKHIVIDEGLKATQSPGQGPGQPTRPKSGQVSLR